MEVIQREAEFKQNPTLINSNESSTGHTGITEILLVTQSTGNLKASRGHTEEIQIHNDKMHHN